MKVVCSVHVHRYCVLLFEYSAGGVIHHIGKYDKLMDLLRVGIR